MKRLMDGVFEAEVRMFRTPFTTKGITALGSGFSVRSEAVWQIASQPVARFPHELVNFFHIWITCVRVLLGNKYTLNEFLECSRGGHVGNDYC